MIRLLVLGSGGFIGSHALRRFESEPDFEVWGADILERPGVDRYIRFDPQTPDFSSLFERGQFDVCLNCTGAANVSESLKNPRWDFGLNVANVVAMLDAIRLHSPRTKFLNLSSAAVYGNPTRLPVVESDDLAPVSPYGFHKVMAESLCQEYARHFGLGTGSVRIFSAYGPGLRKQLLWDLFQKSLAGPVVELGGTGAESRDFVYIDDIVDALVILVRKAPFTGDRFNLASGSETAVADIAKRLLSSLSYGGVLKFEGTVRAGDPLHWRADISRLRQLGFSPSVTIDQGVRACAQWMNDQR